MPRDQLFPELHVDYNSALTASELLQKKHPENTARHLEEMLRALARIALTATVCITWSSANIGAASLLSSPAVPSQFANLIPCHRDSPPASTDNCRVYPSSADPVPAVYDGSPATIYTDPIFKTKIKRITPQPGLPAGNYVPLYSPSQAWNSDETKLLLLGPSGNFYLFNGQDPYRFIKVLDRDAGLEYDGLDISPLWDPQNPDRIWYTHFNQLRYYTVSSGRSTIVTVVHKIGAIDLDRLHLYVKTYDYCGISESGNRIAFKVVDGGGQVYAMLVFDIPSNKFLSVHDFTPAGDMPIAGAPMNKRPGAVCISPDGDFTEWQWNYDRRDSPNHYGTEIYDVEKGTFVRRISDFDTHADQMRLADGVEALVALTSYATHNDYNRITATRYRDGAVVNAYLPDAWGSAVDGQWHVSGRGSVSPKGAPGWVLMSTYDGPKVDSSPPYPLGSEIYALRMDGSNEVRRIAHHQSVRGTDYFAEPHATANRSFTKVLFGSNWRQPAGTLNAYVVELR